MAKKFNTKNETAETQRDLGNRKKLSTHDLISFKPKGPRQEEFAGYFIRDYDVIIQRGSAGTGKTAIAMYYAMMDVFDESISYDKIIYIKPPVEERKRGFVPGDLSDKDAQFEISVREVTNELLKFNDGYDHMKSLKYLEFATTGHRGRTFKDTIVICDEAQNYDYKELKTVIERIGEGSRLIVVGDETQEDLSRHREKSGFEKFIRVCNTMRNVSLAVVNYRPEDNVRSGISRAFCIADYYYKGD